MNESLRAGDSPQPIIPPETPIPILFPSLPPERLAKAQPKPISGATPEPSRKPCLSASKIFGQVKNVAQSSWIVFVVLLLVAAILSSIAAIIGYNRPVVAPPTRAEKIDGIELRYGMRLDSVLEKIGYPDCTPFWNGGANGTAAPQFQPAEEPTAVYLYGPFGVSRPQGYYTDYRLRLEFQDEQLVKWTRHAPPK